MEPNQLTDEQKQALDDQLKRAGAFEELIRTKGWEYLKAYYTFQVQSFASGLLVSDGPIEEFEGRRREIMGLKKLLAFIDGDLNVLADFRKKQDGQPPTTAATE